jgi:hypothetical protein
VKLPLWRLILGILVLVLMATILISLAPVYFENYQLGQYVKGLVRASDAGDDGLRAAVIERAHQLDLPVEAGDIQITRLDGKVDLETRYVVQIDYPLYQVDIHLHAGGTRP